MMQKKLTGPYTHAKFLFKDDDDNYIVGENFELKRDAPSHHPLVMLQLKVDELQIQHVEHIVPLLILVRFYNLF